MLDYTKLLIYKKAFGKRASLLSCRILMKSLSKRFEEGIQEMNSLSKLFINNKYDEQITNF